MNIFNSFTWEITQPTLSPTHPHNLEVGLETRVELVGSSQEPTLGFCIQRFKDVAVRHRWHPSGVVPKQNSLFDPNLN
jgi:hypothetical protein